MIRDKIEQILLKSKLIRVQVWMLGVFSWVVVFIVVSFGAAVERGATKTNAGPVARTAYSIARVPAEAISILRGIGGNDFEAREQRFRGAAGFWKSDDSAATDEGLLLLPRYDGALGRSIVDVLRLSDGVVVHSYAPDIPDLAARTKLTEEVEDLRRDYNTSRYLITHPWVGDDGSLIFHGMYTPLAKVNACSEVEWTLDGLFHHSIEQDADGNFWTAKRRLETSVKYTDDRFYDDAIVKFSADGEMLFERSVGNLLIANGLGYLIYGQGTYFPDRLHLNDVQPVLSDGPFWRRGDLFLSLRHHSSVLLYRPETDRIIWHKEGPWMMQHDVDVLDGRRIAVFNNNTAQTAHARKVIGWNNIMEYDFESDEISTPYEATLKQLDVRTKSEGLASFLPNGDVMIEEQNFGRILRTDAGGNVRWQYVNRTPGENLFIVRWSRYVPPAAKATLVSAFEHAQCSGAFTENLTAANRRHVEGEQGG